MQGLLRSGECLGGCIAAGIRQRLHQDVERVLEPARQTCFPSDESVRRATSPTWFLPSRESLGRSDAKVRRISASV
jgi:hypothetical protein